MKTPWLILVGVVAACDNRSNGSDSGVTAETGADALSCSAPGTPTTPVLGVMNSPTSNYNVTANACTRTARALECELGVGHQLSIVVEGSVRRIRANGIPNHDVGPFPGPGNPNAIAPQVYMYAVPVTPSGTGAVARIFGITTSGAVLDPGTAERWNDRTDWVYEAMRYATSPGYFSGMNATDRTMHPLGLGLDCNFAHVQPTGAYHYHGIPTGLMPSAPAMTFVGWAGDGYPIYGRWDYSNANDPSSNLAEMRSSYRLRSGTRPAGMDGPGGTYDGTFVQDWEYVAGSGDLDACNGREGMVPLEGRMVATYHYVLTHTFPYIPRCFHATPDPSFTAMPMMGAPDGGMMTGPIACTMSSECTNSCGPGRGCTCATTPMGMRCVPSCMTAMDCPAGMQGMMLQCRNGACVP